MNRAHREVYTKGKPKLDHLAPDRLDPYPKPLRARTITIVIPREPIEEKGFLERSLEEANGLGLVTKCAAVESVPGKLGGAWAFRGTRMPVAAVFENLQVA